MSLDSNVHDGTWAKDGSTGHAYLTLVPYESDDGRLGAGYYYYTSDDGTSPNGEFPFILKRINSDRVGLFQAVSFDGSSYSGYTYVQTPETNGEFWYEFSDGTLSEEYTIVFQGDRQTCTLDGYVNCTLDKPLRINEFQFPLTGQSRFGSSYANGSDEFIFDTMVHEFGHILGITSSWWKQNAVHRSEFANEDEWDTFMASSTHIPSYRGARANAFYKNVLNGSEAYIPIEQYTVTLTLENVIAAQTNTAFKFVRASDEIPAIMNISTGATTDGATFAAALAQQFTAAAVVGGDLEILSGLSASSNGTTITITAHQSFTVAATDANTQGMLVGINDDTAQAPYYGAGSAGSHWDEAHFGNEMLSTAGSDGIDEKMSGMTIAALEDQGYPIRNGPKMGYDLTDAYSLPSASTVVASRSASTVVASRSVDRRHHCCKPPSSAKVDVRTTHKLVRKEKHRK